MKVIIGLFLAMLSVAAFADATYPWSTPSYVPTAVSPSATLSAPGTYAMTTQNVAWNFKNIQKVAYIVRLC